MKNKKYTYSEYMDNAKKLFQLLFGTELYTKLRKTKLKSIDWQGIDVDASGILATFPNIKERFDEKWIEYFKEHDTTLLDLYLQVIFHYGYQQCEDNNIDKDKLLDILLRNSEAKTSEKKCFGVIATSTLMFLKWKKEQGHETGPSAARKYVYNGDMYVCLIKAEQCCGYTFDEIIEIYDAYNNPEYERIKEIVKPTLKSKK